MTFKCPVCGKEIYKEFCNVQMLLDLILTDNEAREEIIKAQLNFMYLGVCSYCEPDDNFKD